MLVIHTTSPCDRSLIPYRDSDIALSICMNPVPTGFPISRCASSDSSPSWLCSGPIRPFPCDHRHTLCRDSGFRDFSRRDFLVTENPEMPNPDSSGSSDTCPSNRTAPTVSGNRGSRFHCARVSRLRKPRYPELRLSGISRHASSLMDGVDPVGKSWIAISCCERSMSSKTPISRTPVG
jgi:hypothetical protein